MAESSGPRHGPQWRDALVSELRALSPRLDVPAAADQATTVRQRLEAQQRGAQLSTNDVIELTDKVVAELGERHR